MIKNPFFHAAYDFDKFTQSEQFSSYNDTFERQGFEEEGASLCGSQLFFYENMTF